MILMLLWAGLTLPFINADSRSQSSYPNRQQYKRSTYLPPVTCNGEHIREALQAPAGCTPREKVIKIPWPNNTDVHQLTPTHVTVARCGGGCDQNKQICVSVASRVKTVPVLLGRCGITAGKCDKECASVQVEEDLECGCECAVKKEDCIALQHYREDLCSCQCLDLSLARNCHDSGRMWDPASCSCQCSIKLQCSTGLVFDDNATCSCIPFVSNSVTEIRSERSSQDFAISWEILIIALLLSIIFFFIILTICLIKNNYAIKKKLRMALNPSLSDKNLYFSPRLALEPENTIHLLDSETEFSSERPTDSSLCSDSDTRTHSSPTHRTSIALSDHSSLSRMTPMSILPNSGSTEQANFPPPYMECLPASQVRSPLSLVNGRPPIGRKPIGVRVPRNQDEMSVDSKSQMGQCCDMGQMDKVGQQYYMGQFSGMGQMDQEGQYCHMGQHIDMGHQHQIGHQIPVNDSMGTIGHVGQIGSLYQSRQSQIVYPMVQNGSNPHIGQLLPNPNMGQQGTMYPLNDNGKTYEMGQNDPIMQVDCSGSLVRMGPKSSSSEYGFPLQINPNNC